MGEASSGKTGSPRVSFLAALHWCWLWLRTGQLLRTSVELIPGPPSDPFFVDSYSGKTAFYLRVTNRSPFELRIKHCVLQYVHGPYAAALTAEAQGPIPPFGRKDIVALAVIDAGMTKNAAARASLKMPGRVEFDMTFDSVLGHHASGSLAHTHVVIDGEEKSDTPQAEKSA
jgi:hypothetical protein